MKTYFIKRTLLFFTIFFSSIISFSQINIDSGLVGYFAFENSATDSSFTGIHGTQNNVASVSGVNNYANSAFGFDGVSSYIDYSNNDRGIVDVVSVSLWIKTTQPAGNHDFLIEKYSWQLDKGYHIAIKNGYPYIGVRNTSGFGVHSWDSTATNLVNDGLWHHILGVITGNDIQFHIDGELESTLFLSATTPDLNTSTPLSIGYYYTGSQQGDHNYYHGDMDEVRIYNRVLNSDEIAHLSTGNLITGIASLKTELPSVKIYPNPASSTIYFESGNQDIAQIEIVNPLGKTVLRIANPTESLDVGNLSSGVYFVRFLGKDSQQISAERLVIQ